MKSDTDKPLISVIIVTRNAGGYLEQALKSIICQRYSRYEIIVIDGASTDDTVDIILKYEDSLDYWISEKDNGIYNAMNKGVQKAKGDWLYFMGADDTLVNCLHKAARYLNHKTTIYHGMVYLPIKNKTLGGKYTAKVLSELNIAHQSIFYPKSVFEDYSYNANYPILADYELNLRLWGDDKYRFQYIPELIAIQSENGVSNSMSDEAFQTDKQRLVEQYLSKGKRREMVGSRLINYAKIFPFYSALKKLLKR